MQPNYEEKKIDRIERYGEKEGLLFTMKPQIRR